MFNFLKIGKRIRSLFGAKIDEEALESLERLFYEADLGSSLSHELSEKVRALLKEKPTLPTEKILEEIEKNLLSFIETIPHRETTGNPQVILIVGVNGNGKTTSVAKLGKWYQKQGKSVLVAAADTFRAAAMDQLELWAQRAQLDIVKGKPNSDPAAVVFDAIQAAKSRGKDIVIVDTAGRLHTKTDLMKELEKIHRVSGKALPGLPMKPCLS